jgi:hypothetical protein
LIEKLESRPGLMRLAAGSSGLREHFHLIRSRWSAPPLNGAVSAMASFGANGRSTSGLTAAAPRTPSVLATPSS